MFHCNIYLFIYYPTLIEQNKMSFKYRNTSSEAMCITGL
jgi:hypothetical protein